MFITFQSEFWVPDALLKIQHFQSSKSLKKCSQKYELISEMLNNVKFKRHMIKQKLSYSFVFFFHIILNSQLILISFTSPYTE